VLWRSPEPPRPGTAGRGDIRLIGGEIPVLICPCNPDLLNNPPRNEPAQARCHHAATGDVAPSGMLFLWQASGVVD
jgi:hypothetical protein